MRQRVRVYALTELSSTAMDEMLNLFRSVGAPQWPWWAPSPQGSEQESAEIWTRAHELICGDGAVQYLVAAENLDHSIHWAKRLSATLSADAARHVLATPSDTDGFAFSDTPLDEWLAFVGLDSL